LLISAVNPGAYVSNLSSDLSADSTWIATIDEQGASSGLFAGFKFYGTGDTGGASTDARTDNAYRAAQTSHARGTVGG